MDIQLDDIITLRHELHRNAELSCKEEQTISILEAFLTARTTLEVVREDGWLYAVYHAKTKVKRPPIAFRAELDALPIDETIDLPYASQHPGTAHKCGHDGHLAALAGFGTMLEQLQPDRDVYLIFQFGEEIGAGGRICSRLIREKNIGSVYACHNWSGFPAGQIIVRPGTLHCASEGLIISFKGRMSHASMPEEGRNPAGAIAALASWSRQTAGPQTLKEDRPLVLSTIVGMNCGGRNFGVSAYEGELALTLRAEREDDLNALKAEIMARAEKLAAEEALSVTFEESDVFPETVCDAEAVEKVIKAAGQLGFSHHVLARPIRASEDFGYFLKECPGAIFYIGNGEDYPEIHTAAFDFPDAHLQPIMQMFMQLCMENE